MIVVEMKIVKKEVFLYVIAAARVGVASLPVAPAARATFTALA
jgi:hypothetical protein